MNSILLWVLWKEKRLCRVFSSSVRDVTVFPYSQARRNPLHLMNPPQTSLLIRYFIAISSEIHNSWCFIRILEMFEIWGVKLTLDAVAEMWANLQILVVEDQSAQRTSNKWDHQCAAEISDPALVSLPRLRCLLLETRSIHLRNCRFSPCAKQCWSKLNTARCRSGQRIPVSARV